MRSRWASKAMTVVVCLLGGVMCAADKPEDLPVLRNADFVRAILKVKGKTELQRAQVLQALYGRKAEFTGEVDKVGAGLDKDKRAPVTIWCEDPKLASIVYHWNGYAIETWIPVEDAAKQKIGNTLKIVCTIRKIEMSAFAFRERPRHIGPRVTVTFESIR